MIDDLKPCPFCGDTYIRVRRNWQDFYTTKSGYTIGCNSLGCVCLHTESKSFASAEEAVKAWNRRVEYA